MRQRWVHRLRRRLLTTKADESGITTLEWLLIVAAVAGLAALAVVLVQNVVNETSEQIAGSSARKTAAHGGRRPAHAVDAARSPNSPRPSTRDANRLGATWNKWDYYFTRTVRADLEITYGDAGIDVELRLSSSNLLQTLMSRCTAAVKTGARGRRSLILRQYGATATALATSTVGHCQVKDAT